MMPKKPEPVGELLDIADGLGTTVFVWADSKHELPAKTTFFTAAQLDAHALAVLEAAAVLCEALARQEDNDNGAASTGGAAACLSAIRSLAAQEKPK